MVAIADSAGWAQAGQAGDEPALVGRARGGDSRAFEQLYRRHSGRVFGLCVRLCQGDGRVRVETYSGEVNAAWWSVDHEEQEIRRDGKGKGYLYVQSFSGDIELREKGVVQKRKDVEVKKDVEKKKR